MSFLPLEKQNGGNKTIPVAIPLENKSATFRIDFGIKNVIKTCSTLYTGAYLCVADTGTTGGSTAETGFLQVTGIPPVLITSPSDKKEVEGKQVTILCEVEANPEPEQSWEKVCRDDEIKESRA